jgi:tetratricopeptide (TPR) repeat protein
MNFILTEFEQRLAEARAHAATKSFPAALKLFASVSKEFTQPEQWEEYGGIAARAGDYDLADRLWRRVLEGRQAPAATLARLAVEYGEIGLYAKARALCIEAASLEPRNVELQLSLASFLARTGGVAEARDAVNKTLALDAGNEAARYLAAHLDRRENKLEAAEQGLRDLLAGALRDPQLVIFAHFELARILDRTERFDEAMAELAEAKRVAATTFDTEASMRKYQDRRERTLRKTKSLPRNILLTWAKSFPTEARTSVPRVAFLGGHPRSGTTLLERILDAHPSVTAGDETLAFASISQLIEITAPEIPAGGLNFLRQRYLKNMAQACKLPGPDGVILDKNPAATSYIPAFLRAFPELRVLIALRDPRDVLVSSYFESLRNVSHFSFERLAEHYSAIMDVWLMVREWEGLNWLETRYEDTVADLEKEGGRVTRFLGLEWHENQAQFHDSNRQKPVMSSNYSVVTQPVYKRAVGRWMVYEKHMAAALPKLEPYCRMFGYA